MLDDLLNAARAIAEQIVSDRRQIHSRPELAYQEKETSELVASRLRSLDIEVQTDVAGTGVIGILQGRATGRTVLLRADMDALPIQEVSKSVFVSQHPGVMHACGHDGHTAMLLGAAKLLSERRDEFTGAVKFMFQPAEEGGFGALRMIEAGLLESPKVDAAFALHVNPLIEAGKISIRNGSFSAAADRFGVKILGRGGHAARPHLNVDPIVVAAQLIMALQTLVSREVDPQQPAVITIGLMEGGTTENVIPDTASIRGTVRTYSPAIRQLLERRIQEVSNGLTATMRAEAEITWSPGYPSVVNHDGGVALVREVAGAMLGASEVVEAEVALVAEDFAYLLERVPGAMFRLGVRDDSWDRPRPTHTSDFSLDESALPIGSAVLAAAALRFIETGLA